jgi:hypothetical protein
MLRKLALAAAALTLLAIFAVPIEDTDFWWHLKTGQYIVQQHRLPVPDPFSYTAGTDAVARFNLTHEWLSQAVLYLVYAAGGFAAVAVVRALLLAAICGLVGWTAARSSKHFWRGIVASLAAASILIAFTADRPAIATFLGVAAFVAILESRRWLWALPAIALIWANCHGGFFLGWIVLAAYVVRDRTLWKVAACSIAASLVNPNGARVLTTLAAYRASPLTASLIEWQRPVLWSHPYGFGLLLVFGAAAMLVTWRRVRVEHWILFAAFALASLLAFRNLPLLAIVSPLVIAIYGAPRFAIPVLAVTALAGIVEWRAPDPTVAEWTVPRAAADFLPAQPKIFNTWEQGGYWIWRGQRVFQDGRALSESAYRDAQQILFNEGSAADAVTGPRKELLDRYGIDVVAMNAIEPVSGALYPLAIALGNPDDTEWQLAYEDTQELIFVRHGTGLTNKFGRVLRHLNNECKFYIDRSPDTPQCARTLADYWIRNQAWPQAHQMLRLYLDHRADPAAAAALARLP